MSDPKAFLSGIIKSYLDSDMHDPEELASLIHDAMIAQAVVEMACMFESGSETHH